MLVAAVSRRLQAMGRKVIDAGIAATPTTGVLVRELQAAGGIQISASHNPAEYNGLKLFSAAGRVIPAADGASACSIAIGAASCRGLITPQSAAPQACSDSVEPHWTAAAPHRSTFT